MALGLMGCDEKKAAELLRGRNERDVAHHLKGREDRLRFRVLNVAHLEAALQDGADVKEAAVDATENHVAQVVDVDVPAFDEFLFALREVELLVEALREVALDERPLRRNEGAVVVRVFAVAETQNVVRVLAQLLEGLRVGGLVVAVLGVGFGHFLVLEEGKRRDDELVELGHRHVLARAEALAHLLGDAFHHRDGDLPVAAERRLADRVDDFLRVEGFNVVVLLDDLQHGNLLLGKRIASDEMKQGGN